MKGLFVDSGGWLALADRRDPLHERARDARDRWLEEGGLLVSTDYVLDETLTLLRARLGLAAARRWWEEVDASRRLRWEWIDPPRACGGRWRSSSGGATSPSPSRTARASA